MNGFNYYLYVGCFQCLQQKDDEIEQLEKQVDEMNFNIKEIELLLLKKLIKKYFPDIYNRMYP